MCKTASNLLRAAAEAREEAAGLERVRVCAHALVAPAPEADGAAREEQQDKGRERQPEACERELRAGATRGDSPAPVCEEASTPSRSFILACVHAKRAMSQMKATSMRKAARNETSDATLRSPSATARKTVQARTA